MTDYEMALVLLSSDERNVLVKLLQETKEQMERHIEVVDAVIEVVQREIQERPRA